MSWGSGWAGKAPRQQIWIAPAAATTTGKATQFSLAATGSLAGIVQPDYPRNLVYTFSAAVTACTIVTTGKDARGNPVVETMTGTDTQIGNVAFSQVTSIAVTAVTGGSGKTLDIGHGKKMGLLSRIESVDFVYKVVIAGADTSVATQTINAPNNTIQFSVDPDGLKRFEAFYKGA